MSSGRNPVVPHNTEDRCWWYLHGEQLEAQFVMVCQKHLGIDASINPEKTCDPTVPDLIVGGKMADLKTQNTPFFTASSYNMDPRYTVTFNRKDYERYSALYPEILIYFWVDWRQKEWRNKRVEYFGGIFFLPFQDLRANIERGAPEHQYIHRQRPGDRNAKSSFLVDIRDFTEVFSAETEQFGA